MCTEPARQPEAVTAGLESDRDAFDAMPSLRRFLSPSTQQFQQRALIDRELLQWLALDARHNAGDEPARQAQFDNGDQRAVRIEGARGSAQIVQLLHGALHRFTLATMDAISLPSPHSIFLRDQLGGCLRRPERHPACRRREARPGSCTERENLHGDAKGNGTSGANREANSTDAPVRGGLLRSSDEAG